MATGIWTIFEGGLAETVDDGVGEVFGGGLASEVLCSHFAVGQHPAGKPS
jgi:hypothetical protein